MICEITASLALDACLRKVGASDRHSAAIDLDEKVTACAAVQVEGESQIGNEADLLSRSPTRYHDAHLEWFTRRTWCWGDDLAFIDEPMADAFCRQLHRHFEIDDLQLMFDEWSAGLSVLPTPFDMGEVDLAARAQKPRAAIGECIDDRCGARRR